MLVLVPVSSMKTSRSGSEFGLGLRPGGARRRDVRPVLLGRAHAFF